MGERRGRGGKQERQMEERGKKEGRAGSKKRRAMKTY